MLSIEIMEFDAAQRKFIFLQKIKLASVPATGDKLILLIDNVSVIFKIYDVHYIANHEVPQINVLRISTLNNYNASGFNDITYFVTSSSNILLLLGIQFLTLHTLL
jgi:hypothetical protein